MKMVVIGGALILLSNVLKALAPEQLSFLPLGGSSIAEIGIVLGTAAMVGTIIQVFRDIVRENSNNGHS